MGLNIIYQVMHYLKINHQNGNLIMKKLHIWLLPQLIGIAGINYSIASDSALSKIEPKTTCSFLQKRGLESQGWGELAGGEYGCPSETKEFGMESEIFHRNDITYYVSSTNGELTELKLMVNVNNPKDISSAKQELLVATQELLSKLGVKVIPNELLKGISNVQNADVSVNGLNFNLVKMPWGTQGQFSIKLVVT